MTVDNSHDAVLGVSVVIAVYKRVALLDALLQSLRPARAAYPGSSEVIVVDDSPSDDAQRIEALCRQHDAQYLTRGPKVTSKRNAGAAQAQHEILLFLDSDCLATEGLLVEHVKPYCNPEVGAVLGLLQFTGPDRWLWRAFECSPFILPFRFPEFMPEAPWGPTANLSMRAEVFSSLGGFDETFPALPGGEDVDLGLRMTRHGLKMRCAKEALAIHSKETWIPVRAMFARMRQWGIAEAYLMERHQDHLVPAIPRRSLLYLVTALLTAGLLVPYGNWPQLALIPAWIIVDLVLLTLFQLSWAGKPLRAFGLQFTALLLVLANEFGLAREILRRRAFHFWGKQMLYTPGQIEGEWHYGGAKMWALFISLLLLIAGVVLGA